MRTACCCMVLLGFVFAVACGSGNKTTVKNPPSSSPEAVFIGSSQLSDWVLKNSFPDKNYERQSGASDTSSDMLARFDSDVIALKPQVVVIWAGENDIDRQLSIDTLHSNIIAMRQKAIAANIRVVLCTVPPKAGTSVDQNPAIAALRDWLISYGASTSTVIADFYAVLSDGSGGIKPEYVQSDGEHLTDAAYAAIAPTTLTAISNAER